MRLWPGECRNAGSWAHRLKRRRRTWDSSGYQLPSELRFTNSEQILTIIKSAEVIAE